MHHSLPTLSILLAIVCFSGAALPAEDRPGTAPPIDHGDDPNVSMYQYKDLKTVPETVPARPLAKAELADRIYHGVMLQSFSQSGFDKRYEKYVAAAGARPSLIGTFCFRWDDGVDCPPELLEHCLQVIDSKPNVIPFIKLYTGDWNPQGKFMKADDILGGVYDDYFQRLAQISREFKKPFLLSIDHEMNGDWFGFSELYKEPGGTDWTHDKYKEIWRKIYRTFQAEGATNVAFAWCPNADARPLGKYDALNSYKLYYPGDEFVDWVGVSFYNDVNHYTLDNFAATYPNKPMILAEWGTQDYRDEWYVPQPYPGHAEWTRRTFEFCTERYPNLKAMAYFYWGDNVDFDRDPDQLKVYRQAIANPKFLSN